VELQGLSAAKSLPKNAHLCLPGRNSLFPGGGLCFGVKIDLADPCKRSAPAPTASCTRCARWRDGQQRPPRPCCRRAARRRARQGPTPDPARLSSRPQPCLAPQAPQPPRLPAQTSARTDGSETGLEEMRSARFPWTPRPPRAPTAHPGPKDPVREPGTRGQGPKDPVWAQGPAVRAQGPTVRAQGPAVRAPRTQSGPQGPTVRAPRTHGGTRPSRRHRHGRVDGGEQPPPTHLSGSSPVAASANQARET